MCAQVGSVAVGDGFREADAATGERADDIAGVRAGLGEQEGVARFRREATHEGEPYAGNIEPHAVRPDHADAGCAALRDELVLDHGEVFVAGLREPGGEEVDRLHALLDRLIDEFRNAGRGDLADDVIDGVGTVENARVALQPPDLIDLRVHRVERVLLVVAGLQQGVEEPAASSIAAFA